MGCLRPWVPRLIWFLTVLTVGMIIWSSTRYPEAMWAPGHLSRYHTDIAGCESCHEPFRGATSRKCLVCHTHHQFQTHAEPEVFRRHQEIIQQAQPCLGCHTEHRGELSRITTGVLRNPHGEFIFRVTGTSSCSDCHSFDSGDGRLTPALLNNPRVQHLREEGDGAHEAGHFAECLSCHHGGQREIDDDD